MLGFLQRSLLLALVFIAACPTPAPDGWREAFSAADKPWLMNVWGNAEGLYIVGGANTPSAGILLQRLDGAFTEVALPEGTPLLNWMTGFGDELVVVGARGTVLRRVAGDWRREETPTQESLWGVWGSARDNLWAVGGSGFEGSEATLLHYDGSAWTKQVLPTLERPNVRALFKVWGSSATDVWAVGQRGALLHYDGSTWTERPSGVDQDLISVWGTDANHVAFVGGRGNGWIVTWDGSEFRRRQPAALPGLNGVWMDDEHILHVCGEQGELARFRFSDLTMLDEFYPETRDAFHSIFGVGGQLISVGGNFSQPSGPYRGLAYQTEL